MLNLLPAWALPPVMKLKITSKAVLKFLNPIPVKNHRHEIKDPNISYMNFQSARISIGLIIDSSLIIIKNTGQSDAKNIKITLDGIPINNYPGTTYKKNHNTISSQESIIIQFCVGNELFPSDSIEIIWDDKEAEEKVYRISLYN